MEKFFDDSFKTTNGDFTLCIPDEKMALSPVVMHAINQAGDSLTWFGHWHTASKAVSEDKTEYIRKALKTDREAFNNGRAHYLIMKEGCCLGGVSMAKRSKIAADISKVNDIVEIDFWFTNKTTHDKYGEILHREVLTYLFSKDKVTDVVEVLQSQQPYVHDTSLTLNRLGFQRGGLKDQTITNGISFSSHAMEMAFYHVSKKAFAKKFPQSIHRNCGSHSGGVSGISGCRQRYYGE